MTYQRLYIACADSRADTVDQAADATFGVGWLRMARGVFTRSGVSWSVASFQATDAQAAQIVSMVEGRPGVFLLRGPDDDGPRVGDVIVDLGDTAGSPSATRYTWRRVVADMGLVLVPKGSP